MSRRNDKLVDKRIAAMRKVIIESSQCVMSTGPVFLSDDTLKAILAAIDSVAAE